MLKTGDCEVTLEDMKQYQLLKTRTEQSHGTKVHILYVCQCTHICINMYMCRHVYVCEHDCFMYVYLCI